jgi:hypothetical protein
MTVEGGGRWSHMSQCGAFTRNSRPCKGLVRLGSDYCPAHDPARQEARRVAASKAARTKPGGEIKDLKEQMRTLADDVLAGQVEPKAAAVVTQIVGAYTRLLELERKFKEHEEFEARIAALEERVRRAK